jgi:uncharacterized protein YggL (DUF469 family)
MKHYPQVLSLKYPGTNAIRNNATSVSLTNEARQQLALHATLSKLLQRNKLTFVGSSYQRWSCIYILQFKLQGRGASVRKR